MAGWLGSESTEREPASSAVGEVSASLSLRSDTPVFVPVLLCFVSFALTLGFVTSVSWDEKLGQSGVTVVEVCVVFVISSPSPSVALPWPVAPNSPVRT